MLRNICRAVISKQALMADSSTSQSENCKKPLIPSFLGSPRFKLFFSHETTDQTHHELTPRSVLDPKSYAQFCNPFCYETLNPQIPKSPKLNSVEPNREGIGLALIKNSDHANKKNKMVLFGTKLRIQIPPPPITESATESPQPGTQLGISTGRLSVSEMELSEDYTCIISHGPDPKTTHIFDNCILETYFCNFPDHHHHNIHHTKEEINFLSYCHTCKKNLEQTNDIYIYRGEKAFCSQECRYQEMVLDEEEN